MIHTPTWLAEKQAEAARKTRPGTCRRCGADVLVGLDGDRCALPATVDPRPAGPADELRALAAGRDSYDLAADELTHRTRWHVLGPRRAPVHVAHACPEETP